MSGRSTSAPAPSKHIFLHELWRQHAGAKVRFLCCVLEYDSLKGHLFVEHAYPPTAASTPCAIIDVNLVVETVHRDILESGRWVNVIGYVQSVPQTQSKSSAKRRSDVKSNASQQHPMVQAVLVWDAGAIRTSEYEKTMEAQREAWRKTWYLHHAQS